MNINRRIANKKNYGGKRGTSDIKYLVYHYTGNDGDSDENNAKYFENNIVQASAHYFVDDDSVTQSVLDDYVAWSVGGKKYPNTKGGTLYGKCTNKNSLSIELCDSVRNGKYDFTENTLKLAAELGREKMRQYNIPIDRVIRHYDVVGKICPKPFVDDEKAWQEFKKRLDSNYKPVSKDESNGIAVDGSWGPATTRATQKLLGTVVDGIISNQPTANKKYLYAAHTSTWQFKSKGYNAGSNMVRALQKLIGAKVDGWFGKNSVLCLQKFLGVKQDASMGPATVRAWQQYINSRL